MKIYTQTGSKRHHEYMRKHGIGLWVLSNSWRNPIKFLSYAVDNGAFHYWKNNKSFNAVAFENTIDKVNAQKIEPDFVVCPDIVAKGKESLEFSIEWADKIPRSDYYLAVQDGMEIEDLKSLLNGFKGIFVGGTMNWKLSTGEQWVGFAHQNNLKCHIGRIGTEKRLLWARRIGADSVDSSTFAQGPPDMRTYRRLIALRDQTCFGGPCTLDKFECGSCPLNPDKCYLNNHAVGETHSN